MALTRIGVLRTFEACSQSFFKSSWAKFAFGALALLAAISSSSNNSRADEGGVSFWLPGNYGSLAAVPVQPGWAIAVVNYYTNLSAGGSISAAREVTIGNLSPTVNVNLNANLHSRVDLGLFDPSYTFATPVLGGQLTLDMAGVVGTNNTNLGGTLTVSAGPFVAMRQGTLSDTETSVGDLYPRATLRWNSGVNSWMAYATGDIPVGAYNSSDLANLGIGHGAVDSGVGYTYFNPQTGHEFSAVTGLTYNLVNPSTNYQNGVDWHLDWGASQFLSKQFSVGVVGYFYDQLSADRGCNPALCPFESRVIGVGPQMTFLFPVGEMQGYLNFKAYGEFDASDRPDGWNAWVTFSLSPAPPSAPSTSSPIVTKALPRS